MVSMIENEEGKLLNIIESFSHLEWRRYQRKNSQVWDKDHFVDVDMSGYPPFICFRFEVEIDDITACLKDSVANYRGAVAWALIEHKREGLLGTNWMLATMRSLEAEEEARMLGKTTGEYLAKLDPEFAPIAYNDLKNLTEYVRCSLSKL